MSAKFLWYPKPYRPDERCANNPAPFCCDRSTMPRKVRFIRHPDKVAPDQRLPVHSVLNAEQRFKLTRDPRGPLALAGENVYGIEGCVLTAGSPRNDDARVCSVRKNPLVRVPLLHER